MSDIVERIRERVQASAIHGSLMLEAADEIERLEAKITGYKNAALETEAEIERLYAVTTELSDEIKQLRTVMMAASLDLRDGHRV